MPLQQPHRPAVDFASPIDELILKQWQDAGLENSEEITDAAFIRRVYLDLMGLVPTAEEIQQFQQDESPDARRKLIDRLINSAEGRTELNRVWSAYFGVQE